MPNTDKPEANCDSDNEFELLEDDVSSPDSSHDQQLTYTQMVSYSLSGFVKHAFVYSSQKLGGCFAVATVAPTAYIITASYFSTPGITSNVLARTTSSALVSTSFDLGSNIGGKLAETSWDISSRIISNTLTYLYNRNVSENKDARSVKCPEKNKKKIKSLKG